MLHRFKYNVEQRIFHDWTNGRTHVSLSGDRQDCEIYREFRRGSRSEEMGWKESEDPIARRSGRRRVKKYNIITYSKYSIYACLFKKGVHVASFQATSHYKTV